MNKGWIVTKDHLEAGCADGTYKFTESKYLPVEVVGPRGCTLTKEELLKGTPFKMYDDDGNLYYSGRLVGDADSEDGFMPLDHYGEPNAGCTHIKYRDKKTGEWKIL